MKLYLLSIFLILTGCFFEEEKPTLSKNFGKYSVEVRVDHKARTIKAVYYHYVPPYLASNALLFCDGRKGFMHNIGSYDTVQCPWADHFRFAQYNSDGDSLYRDLFIDTTTWKGGVYPDLVVNVSYLRLPKISQNISGSKDQCILYKNYTDYPIDEVVLPQDSIIPPKPPKLPIDFDYSAPWGFDMHCEHWVDTLSRIRIYYEVNANFVPSK